MDAFQTREGKHAGSKFRVGTKGTGRGACVQGSSWYVGKNEMRERRLKYRKGNGEELRHE